MNFSPMGTLMLPSPFEETLTEDEHRRLRNVLKRCRQASARGTWSVKPDRDSQWWPEPSTRRERRAA